MAKWLIVKSSWSVYYCIRMYWTCRLFWNILRPVGIHCGQPFQTHFLRYCFFFYFPFFPFYCCSAFHIFYDTLMVSIRNPGFSQNYRGNSNSHVRFITRDLVRVSNNRIPPFFQFFFTQTQRIQMVF